MGNSADQYRDVVRALYRDNPSVRHSLDQMRARGGMRKRSVIDSSDTSFLQSLAVPRLRQAPVACRLPRRVAERSFTVAYLLLVAGLVSLTVVVGPPAIRFVLRNWRVILICIGAGCVGAAITLLLGRIGLRPLRKLQPPSPDTEEPLRELKSLAERTARRLRTAYKVQVSLLVMVFTGFAVIVGWTMMLVSQERIAYACAFGSGGVAMVILSKWKWQPFDRMAEALRLAGQADALATGLRMRMRTIQEIKDPAERSKAQWKAVQEYMELS